MTGPSRREAFALAGGAGALLIPGEGRAAAAPAYRRGFDNQRIADIGDGRFLNPVFAGDRPDPAILKDGPDYYLTFSSFDSYPGVVIWHSRDLVNWRPIGPALRKNIGSVWAVSLAKHNGRYFVYIPVKSSPNSIFVIHADRIEGPWSDPIDLALHSHIDPCHAVGEDGSRWLFLSGGDRVRLAPDGLSTLGKIEHVYDPWHYPADWVVESFSPEGPKLVARAGWFYLITAVGGTAGPPTGHMVIAARSRSIHGPWENCPSNPLVRTTSETECWWSRGHASLIEGPAGDWWALYHGYEAGFWTLGRQTLLDRVEWTRDGWFRMTGGDLSQPLPKPGGGTVVRTAWRCRIGSIASRLGPNGASSVPARTRPAGRGSVTMSCISPRAVRHLSIRPHCCRSPAIPPIASNVTSRSTPARRRDWCCSTTTSSIVGSGSTSCASSPINMVWSAGARPIRMATG
jgi:hypothetical protein